MKRTIIQALLVSVLMVGMPGEMLRAELTLDSGERLALEQGETFMSGLIVASGATLAGEGTVVGAVTVDGLIDPGVSSSAAGTLTFNGGLLLNTGGVTILDLLADGVYDKITGTGSRVVMDGQLKVVLASGYTPSGAAVFNVIECAAGIEGAFDNVAGSRVTPYLATDSLASSTFQCALMDSVTLRLSGYGGGECSGPIYSFR
jgi:hypothetical protein